MKYILSRSLVLSLCLLLSLPAVADAFFVNAPQHTIILSAEKPNPGVSGSTLITATVTSGDVPVPGRNIVFTWMVKGSSMVSQPGPTLASNASGQASYTLNNTAYQGGHRSITVMATLQSDPSVTTTVDVQFGEALPASFIARHESSMSNWSDARAYCQQQGGRLPQINDSNSWSWDDRDKITHIDGFGATGAPWPSGLPGGDHRLYWMGTRTGTSQLDHTWAVGNSGGTFGVNTTGRNISPSNVVCVP